MQCLVMILQAYILNPFRMKYNPYIPSFNEYSIKRITYDMIYYRWSAHEKYYIYSALQILTFYIMVCDILRKYFLHLYMTY